MFINSNNEYIKYNFEFFGFQIFKNCNNEIHNMNINIL